VAQTLLHWMRFAASFGGFSMRPVGVNGHPGALGLDGQQRVLFVVSLEIADGQVQGIRSIVNPDKLRHLGPVSDLLPTPAADQRFV
jgi:RNA polymerase sigma-70 factor (ECF subfamily)